MDLTHLDKQNRPKMVDVSEKQNTTRIAIASGICDGLNLGNNARASLIEKTGVELRTMMPWIASNKIVDQDKN